MIEEIQIPKHKKEARRHSDKTLNKDNSRLTEKGGPNFKQRKTKEAGNFI